MVKAGYNPTAAINILNIVAGDFETFTKPNLVPELGRLMREANPGSGKLHFVSDAEMLEDFIANMFEKTIKNVHNTDTHPLGPARIEHISKLVAEKYAQAASFPMSPLNIQGDNNRYNAQLKAILTAVQNPASLASYRTNDPVFAQLAAFNVTRAGDDVATQKASVAILNAVPENRVTPVLHLNRGILRAIAAQNGGQYNHKSDLRKAYRQLSGTNVRNSEGSPIDWMLLFYFAKDTEMLNELGEKQCKAWATKNCDPKTAVENVLLFKYSKNNPRGKKNPAVDVLKNFVPLQ
jgi:hypothetical protein